MTSLQRFTYAERPELAAALEEEEAGAFPEFLLHDRVWNECWPHIIELFAEHQSVLYDPEREAIVGGSNAVPLRWDGTLKDLPQGTHAVMLRSIDEHRKGIPPNAICGIQAIATAEARGQGLSEALMAEGRERAKRFGFEHWLSPLRLLLKGRYPLASLEDYIAWQRSDGSPFDPWLRVWLRAGAEILRVAHDAIVIEASVAEWEEWTGLELPASGEYVIPDGQLPLHVDREASVARYSESHLWLRMPPEQ